MASRSQRRAVSVLITDLDNTLWNWFEIWYSGFDPMLRELHIATGIPLEQLKREIRSVYQKHHTSEYSRLMQEMPSLQERFGMNFDPTQIPALDKVVHAFRSGRKAANVLYPGVKDTLDHVKGQGAITIGFTESQFYYTTQRIRTLGLDGHLDHLYTTANSGVSQDDIKRMQRHPEEYYSLKETKPTLLPVASKKPDAAVLCQMVERLKISKEAAIYVGDDLRKDISMANAAGVTSVHAAYGVAHNDSRYELLKEVTHWTPDDVRAQTSTSSPEFTPTHSIGSFAEIKDLFEFVRYTPGLDTHAPELRENHGS